MVTAFVARMRSQMLAWEPRGHPARTFIDKLVEDFGSTKEKPTKSNVGE